VPVSTPLYQRCGSPGGADRHAAISSRPLRVSTTPPLPRPLAGAIARLEAGFSGIIGLWVHDLLREETFGLRSDDVLPPASTIKLFVLRELFRQVEAGRVSLSEPVVTRKRDIVPGTGVLKDLESGLRLGLGDAAMLMITVSDNMATNLVIGRLGTRTINRATREAGFLSTRLSGKLYRRHDHRSATTASDLGTLMLHVARRQEISPTASMAMLDMLRREQSAEIVGRHLVREHDGGERWVIASKNGALDGVRHDVAYVSGRRARYIVALMSSGCTDLRYSVDNEATLCLARAAQSVHDYICRTR
jgi:beta-lactamase class A